MGGALEQLILQAIVECLADQVMARLGAAADDGTGCPAPGGASEERRALVLFTGTDIGLSAALASLATLRARGWRLDLVASDAARPLLPPDLRPDLTEETDTDALLARSERLLVGTLSITAAAKIATGLRDSLASRLVARALELGRPVTAAFDGACPDDPARARRGFAVAEPYRAMLRGHLLSLKSFGIRLVPARALAAVEQNGQPLAVEEPAFPPPAATAGKRVFSRGDAVTCRGGVLRLAADVVVTPLAADELNQRNVRLIRL